jgi:hypothetical protein
MTAPSSISPLPRAQVEPSLRLPDGVWRAGGLGSAAPSGVPSGFPGLDAVLPGGGWPKGCLTELICREAGIGEVRLLAPLLSSLTRARRFVVLLAPPLTPYAPALAGFGIDLDYLILIQARQPADRLWAIEQSLKSSGFGALLAWLPQARTRPEHLRRLQSAAQSAGGPVFLFRELAAQFEPSAAPLRMLLLPQTGQRLSVQLLKRRGPLVAHPLSIDLPQPLSLFGLRPDPDARTSRPQPDTGHRPAPISRHPAMQALHTQPADPQLMPQAAVQGH